MKKLYIFYYISLWIQTIVVLCLIGICISDHNRINNTLYNIESWISYSQTDQDNTDNINSSVPSIII